MTGIGNYTYAQAVTKSDTVDVPLLGNQSMANNGGLIPYFDALYVSVAGTVILFLPDGTQVTFTCIAGQILPVRGRRVGASSGATVVALYYF